jgi:hypothetical protein
MLGLQSLVAAVRQLGIPRGVDTGAVRDLVESFVAEATGSEGWKGMKDEGAIQAAVDVGFLNLVSGQSADKAAAATAANVSCRLFFTGAKLTSSYHPPLPPRFLASCRTTSAALNSCCIP